MNNFTPTSTPSDILALIKNHGREILDALHKRKDERGISNADIINLTGVPQSSFYRFWDGDGKNLNPDHISKICLLLGVSVDDFRRDPDDTSIAKLGIPAPAHEEVMTNLHAEISKQRETIAELNALIEELKDKNTFLESTLKERSEKLISAHADYSIKIDKLTNNLLDLHSQMHNVYVTHNARIDHLNDELVKRHERMYELLHDVFSKAPETVKKIIQQIEE